jgi:hypothetical protein
MTPHAQVRQALRGLAGDRVFPLVADEGTAAPYVVFTIVGGNPQEFLSGEKPEKKWRRVQTTVWSKSTTEASEIADQAEDALRAAPLQTEVLTVAIDTYDETTKLRGAMQEFYIFC